MKKVLVIAYHYPPLGGVGVFRTLSFTKYLSRFGYQPYVLTTKNPMYGTTDSTLLKDIPPEAKVYRTLSLEHKILKAPRRLLHINLKWLYIPDENVGWLPTAVITGAKLVKRENISVIYATSPSWTSLLIGFLIKKRTRRPLVVDYRDPWTDNVQITYPSRLHRSIERKMEEKVLSQADFVTVATESIKNRLIEHYPFLRAKVQTITNGFDPDDFKKFRVTPNGDKFRITFTGSIYGLLTARPFLSALKKLLEENDEMKGKIEAIFMGNLGRETTLLVKEFGLEKNVKLVDHGSHEKSIELMMSSEALLLLITIEGQGGEGILTGKLFEYLASRRPIIAIVPTKGEAAKIIESLDAGTVASPRDISSIKMAMSKFYEQWARGSPFRGKGNIDCYTRKFLTQQIAQIFDKVIVVKNNQNEV